MAGLLVNSAMVRVGPPLAASLSNLGSVFWRLESPKDLTLSELRLKPASINEPNAFRPEGLPVRMEFMRISGPAAVARFPPWAFPLLPLAAVKFPVPASPLVPPNAAPVEKVQF